MNISIYMNENLQYINIFLDVDRYGTFFRNALVLLLGLYCPLIRISSSNGRKCPNGNVAANWSKLWADYNEDKFYGRHPPQYPPAHAGVALNLKWSHFRGASITRHTHTITILSTTTRSTNTELSGLSFRDFQIGSVKAIGDNLLSNKKYR